MPTSSEEKNTELVRRWYREVWCHGSVAAAREMCDPAVVAHLEGMPDTDLDGFLEFHAALRDAFSDLHVEILEATASGDKVVVHWYLTGLHTGPFLGVPPSHRSVAEWGMTKFKVAEGRFVEGWDSWNLNAFLESLAQTGARAITDGHPGFGSQNGAGRVESDEGRAEPTGAAALAVRWFEEIWNQRRKDTVEELWRDGAVGHMEGLPPVTKEDFLAFQAELTGAFSDLRVEIIEVIAKGNRASIEWCLTGTHDGPLFGVPPSGRKVREHGMTRLVFEDGKMVAGRDHWNMGAMLERLARPTVDQLVREHRLTARQAEVALHLADRRSAKDIAKRLGIAVNTARRHTQAVFLRLGVHDRSAVAAAIGTAEVPLAGPHSLEG